MVNAKHLAVHFPNTGTKENEVEPEKDGKLEGESLREIADIRGKIWGTTSNAPISWQLFAPSEKVLTSSDT